jgi:thiol-disulfide isomerase/thioredoxin
LVSGAACDEEAGSSQPAVSSSAEPRLVEVGPEEIGPLLRDQPGPVLMVNVWSTWCEPCVEELPELVRVGRDYEGRGLSTLFLSADPPSQHDAALAFLREQGVPMPGYVKRGSDDAFIEALHPEWSGSLPATMLFDAERRPRELWERTVDRAALSGPIERRLDSR